MEETLPPKIESHGPTPEEIEMNDLSGEADKNQVLFIEETPRNDIKIELLQPKEQLHTEEKKSPHDEGETAGKEDDLEINFDGIVETDGLLEEKKDGEEMKASQQGGAGIVAGFMKLRTTGIIVSVILYTLLSFVTPLVAQIVPVWVTRDTDEDGLSFEEQQLGIMYSCGSFVSLCFQLALFSKVDKTLGSSYSFRLAIVIYMFIIFFMPFAAFLTDYRKLLWVSLLVLYGGFALCLSWAYGAVNILLSNASTADIIGLVNGISVSLGSVAKLIAPVAGDSLFAWSSNLDSFYPFNYMFVFHLAAFVGLCCLICTVFLPATLSSNRA